MLTWEFTPESNHTSVHCVTKVSVIPATCRDINVICTATEDHITVLTVGSCLWQKVNWSVMFVFTLVQSRTHVDTVQSALEGLTNSRHIWWSHTMKVLGSRVRYVRKHSSLPVTYSATQYDIHLWSRMFAVNVQIVSIQTQSWSLIIGCTQSTNSFAVFCVIKVSSIKTVLYSTLRDVLLSEDLLRN